MAWWNPYSWGAAGEQARQDQLDAQLRALNERDYSPGGAIYERIEAERGQAAAAAERQIVQQHEQQQVINVEQSLDEAFQEGLEEGYNDMTSGARNALAAPFKVLWDSIPWQLWLAAAVAVFIYFGGLDMLKRKFAKA